jgi:hypothetical protein
MKARRIFFVCMALLFTLGIVIMGRPARAANTINQAQSLNNPCTGVDVVFLVSYSNSMNGNDPVGIRKHVLETALETIGDNAVYLCPGFRHRVAIVGFGDGQNLNRIENGLIVLDPVLVEDVVKTYGGNQVIAPTLDNLDDWAAQKAEIFRNIPDNIDNSYTIAHYSNFQAGLQKAASKLSNWRNEDKKASTPISLAQKQAVIIISDGDMCIYKSGAKTEDDYICDYDNLRSSIILNSIKPLVDPDSAYLPSSVSISHISIYSPPSEYSEGMGTNFMENPNIKEFWTTIVQNHSGQLVTLEQTAHDRKQKAFVSMDIDAKMSVILGNLLGSDLNVSNCSNKTITPIWVEPYKNNFLILYVNRFGAVEGKTPLDVDVSITIQSGGNAIAEIKKGELLQGNVDFRHDFIGPNERYIFFQPPPGQYSFQVENAQDPCKDVSILTGDKGIGVELKAPENGQVFQEYDQDPFYEPQSPNRFRIQLLQLDKGGASLPVEQLMDFPIHLEVQVQNIDDPAVVDPNNPYELNPIDPTQGIYESIKPIYLKYPGHYTWRLAATSNDPRSMGSSTSSNIEVASSQGTYVIEPLFRQICLTSNIYDLASPVIRTDKTVSQPIPVQIQVIDQDTGQPLRDDLQISAPNQHPFQADLYAKVNSTWTQVDTETMALEKGNIYSAQLLDTRTGVFQETDYQIRISLGNQYASTSYGPGKCPPPDKAYPIPPPVKEVTVKIVIERDFSWQVKSPVSKQVLTTRPILNWFAKPDTSGIFAISVAPADAKPILVSEMVNDIKKPLFLAKIINGTDQKSYDIKFLADPSSNSFLADWPVDAPPEGSYILKSINLEKDNLSPAWIPTNVDAKDVNFNLHEEPWTSPWSMLALIELIVFLIWIIIMFILNAGPLYGFTLDIRMGEFIESIKIYRFLVTYGITIRKKQIDRVLPNAGIEKIVIKPVKPTIEDAKIAVDVIIYWSDGSSVETVLNGINEGEEGLVTKDFYVRLTRIQAGFLGKAGAPLLIGLAMLAIWAGIFGLLTMK